MAVSRCRVKRWPCQALDCSFGLPATAYIFRYLLHSHPLLGSGCSSIQVRENQGPRSSPTVRAHMSLTRCLGWASPQKVNNSLGADPSWVSFNSIRFQPNLPCHGVRFPRARRGCWRGWWLSLRLSLILKPAADPCCFTCSFYPVTMK